MTEEEIKKIIHQYLIDNLNIQLEGTSDWYSNRYIELTVKLGEDIVSSNSISL